MEVVYYPKYPSCNRLTKPTKMKRRSLMQRLSSWFEDHLPLRRRSDVRRSERGSRRKASKSAAPRMRYSVTNAQKQNDLVELQPSQKQQQHQNLLSSSTTSGAIMSTSMIGKDSIYDDGYTDHHRYHSYFDDMSVSTFSHLGLRNPLPSSFNDTPLSQSFSSTYSSCRRPRIRTNPWISSSSNNQHRSSSSSHTQQSSSNNNNNSASMIFRSPAQPSTSLVSRSIYSAPDALSSSAALSKCQQQHQQQMQQHQSLKPPELLYSSMDRTAQLRVKSLDESTCSSGYGSQDSSPESSVHSPDWQQQTATQQSNNIRIEEKSVEAGNINNNTVSSTTGTIMGLRNYHPNIRTQHQLHHHDDDEHVYHELESLHRLSLLLEERACSSEGEFLSPQPTQEEKPTMMEEEEDGSRSSSPIYAVPYDSQRNSLCSENPLILPQFISKPSHLERYENPYARIQQQPLSIESPFFQKQNNSSSTMASASASSTSNYAIPFQSNVAPQWHCPPPPPLDKNANGEVDFLAELDKQIAELQIQSDAVRHLVEQAKERQELREKTRILCMEHINELRKMRWFMRNNFELCL